MGADGRRGRHGGQGARRARQGGPGRPPGALYRTAGATAPIPRPRSTAFCRPSRIRACWPTTPTGRPTALGVRLVRLAHAAWAQSSIAPLARPYIDRLSAEVGETIHLAQLDLGQVLYVDKRNAQRPVEMFSQAGKVGPAYCTGVGKAMLAYLPRGRADARAGTPVLPPLHRAHARHPRQAAGRACRRFAPAASPSTAKSTSRASSASPCRF